MPNKNACVLCLRSDNNNPGLSLFGFPKDPKLLKIWLFKCGLNEGDIIQSHRVLCSFNFAETDFGKGVKRRSLKHNSIPTIFEEDHQNQEPPSTSFEGVHYVSRPSAKLFEFAEIQTVGRFDSFNNLLNLSYLQDTLNF